MDTQQQQIRVPAAIVTRTETTCLSVTPYRVGEGSVTYLRCFLPDGRRLEVPVTVSQIGIDGGPVPPVCEAEIQDRGDGRWQVHRLRYADLDAAGWPLWSEYLGLGFAAPDLRWVSEVQS